MDFCVTILILKMEENKQHFWYILLCYFKKGKNAAENSKKIVQYMETVLWLIECIKSGLQSFMLEISPWMMMLLGRGRPVEVDSNQIETLIENNHILPCER